MALDLGPPREAWPGMACPSLPRQRKVSLGPRAGCEASGHFSNCALRRISAFSVADEAELRVTMDRNILNNYRGNRRSSSTRVFRIALSCPIIAHVRNLFVVRIRSYIHVLCAVRPHRPTQRLTSFRFTSWIISAFGLQLRCEKNELRSRRRGRKRQNKKD